MKTMRDHVDAEWKKAIGGRFDRGQGGRRKGRDSNFFCHSLY